MRIIGQISGETAARNFSDFLLVNGIENDIEPGSANSWDLWIRAEEQLEPARRWLMEFQENPANPKFHKQSAAASEIKARQTAEDLRYQRKVKARKDLFRSVSSYQFGPLTFALIFLCVIVAINTRMQSDSPLYAKLYFAQISPAYFQIPWGLGGLSERLHSLPDLLPEIFHGEFWRLITPVFLNFGIMHILFNMLWLKDLGSMIEGRQGTLTLLALVLGIAVVSNSLQFIVGGPRFGGMSGVVYGLAGYIWIRGKRDPSSGLFLHPSTMGYMLIWFFICFTGLVGDIANGAHAGGLLAGMAWGYLSSLKYS